MVFRARLKAPVSQPRKIDCGCLQVEAVCQSQSGERQPIAFPVGCAAQLRKRLAHPRRRDHDLSRAEAPRFNVAGGEIAVAQQDQRRAVLHAYL